MEHSAHCRHQVAATDVMYLAVPVWVSESVVMYFVLTAISCSVLPTPGDESLVTDFVPVSPPRRLHPDTGQLVVRPNAMQSRPPRNDKVKKKKDQGDKMEKKAETIVTEMGEYKFCVLFPSVCFFVCLMYVWLCVCAN